MIPLIQWSVYCCDGKDHLVGWTSGRGVVSSSIGSFSEPIATTSSGLLYLIHPDSQGVNFRALFLLDRWVRADKIANVTNVTAKYYLSHY
jgi:hypothetical protein